MRLSRSFFHTLKEVPKDARIPSHRLMYRAGMIQQAAGGIYSYLPAALRCIRKIENIIRDELNRRGCEEVLMPAVQPAELWRETGRWDLYDDLLLRFKDRKGGDFCMGPTHEEVITDMVRRNLRSWKQLPWNLYQIQGKFRDEFRPRFGLMRAREFIMKDAYSFDRDTEGAKASYRLMYEAYEAIFRRCGLKFRAVDAASGEIGGDLSHEFQVTAETGEEVIVSCGSCDYAANVEKAGGRRPAGNQGASGAGEAMGGGAGGGFRAGDGAGGSGAGEVPALEVVDTPDQRTIEAVSRFLGEEPGRFLKSLVYEVDSEAVLVLIAGDRDVNEAKLQTALGAGRLRLAPEELVVGSVGVRPGSVGPVGLRDDLKVVADWSVEIGDSWLSGANEEGRHFRNVQPGRDFPLPEFVDIGFARAGDGCPRCDSGVLEETRAIEVGHVFYLGTKYSEAMGCSFLDETGAARPAEMGCYGIGVGRTMAAAIEQNHDENGIAWPGPLAPWEVVVLPLQLDNEAVTAAAEEVYAGLGAAGIDAVIDDRRERAGFKFKDADLMGYPVQIVLGARSVGAGKAELKYRASGEKGEAALDAVVNTVAEWVSARRGGGGAENRGTAC